ncbi:MAG TPA: DNA starvation/stationary phase protection protein [Acidimicrobiales bacterium]
MTEIGIQGLDTDTRQEVARELQDRLVDFIALSLNGKQAHWHVTGRQFVPLHEQLDAIVDDARSWSDLVAERAVTLGVAVDGRPSTVAETTEVAPFHEGFVGDEKVVGLMVDELAGVAERTRRSAERLGELDLVSQDLLIEILRGLEKHLWMLQAQQA